MLVTFEGIDGCGKTSVIESCRAHFAALYPTTVTSDFASEPALKAIMANDPCPFRQYIAVLQARITNRRRLMGMTGIFEADPLILYDRYLDSTLAYQGTLGIPAGRILADHTAALLPLPDLTIILNIDIATAATRRGDPGDAMESRSDRFFNTVARTFLDNARAGLARYRIVDASAAPATVARACIQHIALALASHDEDGALSIHDPESRCANTGA